MKLGLQIPSFTWPGGPATLASDLARVATDADDAGFGYIGVMDHFFQIRGVGPSEQEMLEAYTTLGYIAAHTQRAKLLTIVTGVHHRSAGLLAKAVTTVDVLSGGRAVLGIGAAWNEEESLALGLGFPPVGDRFALLEETLQYVLKMWSDDEGPFHGVHIHADRLLNSPQPLSRPHPPILIGGGGERKTLRLVARYGQACNLFDSAEDLPRKFDVLRAHCEAEGRDYDEITKTVYRTFDVGPRGQRTQELIDSLGRLHDLGVDDVLGGIPDVATSDGIARIGADVIPVVATL